jgi:Silencing defective 2 N-terminal ubiquitin domain
MQIFVKGLSGTTFAVCVPDPTRTPSVTRVHHIKQCIEDREGVPVELQRLLFCGKQLESGLSLEECNVQNESTIHVLLRLPGGKGGFGAMLRAKAKQKGAKKTTDFGACRDLSGRRLRHVNDEVILKKWKDAKDQDREFDPTEETASGVELWHLAIPSWADGVKSNPEKIFQKERRHTALCKDWLKAREDRNPPAGAPLHWGCSRGAKCSFAHGEEELRGPLLDEIKEKRKRDKTEDELKQKQTYLEAVEANAAALEDDAVEDAVVAGLKAAKRAKKLQKELFSDGSTEINATSIEGGSSAAESDELPLDFGF